MEIEIVPVVSRWLHIAPVIVAIGGAFLLRFALLPAARETLDDEQHGRLRAALIRRWRVVVHVSIVLIFLSGLYNVYRAIVILHKPVVYHMLFGVKLLSALGVFFIASALVGRSETFDGMRAQSGKWLSVLLCLAALIILISGVMKNLPSPVVEAGDQAANHSSVQADWA